MVEACDNYSAAFRSKDGKLVRVVASPEVLKTISMRPEFRPVLNLGPAK